jgi:hypothetical protein
MQTYGDLDLFPVRVVVPLILSMRITVNIKNVCVWDALEKNSRNILEQAPLKMRERPPDHFFSAPSGYKEMTMGEQLLKSMRRDEMR